MQASAKIAGHGYHHNDVYLHTAPLTHVGGLVSWLAMLQVLALLWLALSNLQDAITLFEGQYDALTLEG